MKVTIENHELVCSRKIDETLAKKLLDHPDRVIALEHDLCIRHKLNHSENGEWISSAKMEFAAGCDLMMLVAKLKESHTILIGQAAVWKKRKTEISEKQKKDISETMKRIGEVAKKATKEEPSRQQEEPETDVYVCLKRMKQGYMIGGNMPLEEVVQALASMFISYATNKK